MTEEFHYDAFITYRHTYPDKEIAARLHTLLETYRTPRTLVKKGLQQRLQRVFRDQEELPTSGNLSDSIVKALQQSRFLIVICSPRTPLSQWVLREIEMFKELGRENQILTLLIEGEPRESFPPPLLGKQINPITGKEEETEPLAADIRVFVTRSDPSTGEEREIEPSASAMRPSRRLREALRKLDGDPKLRLLAPLFSCSFDDLKQREQERQLQNKRKIIGVVSSLLVVFALLAVIATWKWLDAERNFKRAFQTAKAMVDNVAVAVKPIAGTKAPTVQKILDSAKQVYKDLLEEQEQTVLDSAKQVYKDLLKEQETAEILPAKGRMLNEFATIYLDMNNTAEALSSAQEALAIFQQLMKKQPNDPELQAGLATSYEISGRVRGLQGDSGAALRELQQSLSLRQQLIDKQPDNLRWQVDLSSSLTRLGQQLSTRGNYGEAQQAFAKALELREKAAQADPGNLEWQRNLGKAHQSLGDGLKAQGNEEQAQNHYEKALAVYEQLTQKDSDNSQWQLARTDVLINQGISQKSAGNGSKADALFQQALRIAERFARLDPTNSQWQRAVLACRFHIADIYRNRNLKEALQDQLSINRQLLGNVEDLVQEDPANADHRLQVALLHQFIGHGLVGLVQQGIGASDMAIQAVAELEQARSIQEQLVRLDPDNIAWAGVMFLILNDLFSALNTQGRSAEAWLAMLKGSQIHIESYRRLAQRDSNNSEWSSKLAWSILGTGWIHYNLAELGLAPAEHLEQALQALQEAKTRYETLLQHQPQNADWLKSLGNIYGLFFAIYQEQNATAEAEVALNKAKELKKQANALQSAESIQGSDSVLQATHTIVLYDPSYFQKVLDILQNLVKVTRISDALVNTPYELLDVVQTWDTATVEGNQKAREVLEHGRDLIQQILDKPTLSTEQKEAFSRSLVLFEERLQKLPALADVEQAERQRWLDRSFALVQQKREQPSLSHEEGQAIQSFVEQMQKFAPNGDAGVSDSPVEKLRLLEQVGGQLESLMQDNPERLEYAIDLARNCANRAALLAKMGRPDEASALQHQAQTLFARLPSQAAKLEELDPIISAEKSAASSQALVVIGLCKEAITAQQNDQSEIALSKLAQAKDIAQHLLQQKPDDLKRQELLADVLRTEEEIAKSLFDKWKSLFDESVTAYQNDRLADALNKLAQAKDIAQRLLQQKPDDFKQQSSVRQLLVAVLQNTAYLQLLTRQPEQALQTARAGLAIAPRVGLDLNLAHALLLTGEFEQAKVIYLRDKDMTLENDGRVFKQGVLDDFKEFHQRGIDHPDIKKIEVLMQ